MKVISYTSVTATKFENDQAKGVSGRVVVGKEDGANHFYMRIFEVVPGGYSARHTHAWEHEIFIHSGDGEMYGDGKWNSVKPGTVLFVPPNAEHQIRNTGKELLIYACLIPAGVPEL